MNRRHFLQATGSSALALTMSSHLHASVKKQSYLDTLGLQLWTVRNQMEADSDSTLKAIADAGYKQVELMSVLDSADIVEVASDLGLKTTSAFINWEAICREGDQDVPSLEEIVEAATRLSLDYLVFGYIGRSFRETIAHYQRRAETANRMGELCRAADMQLCYHNHAFEFETLNDRGDCGFDVLINEFDEQLVKFELDVFWAAIGGWDPVQTIEKLGTRTCQLHLKDWQRGGEIIYDEGAVPDDAFQEVGDGSLDFPAILTAAREHSIEQCHVEQDQSPDPVESIGQSIRYLRSID